jgi:predicted  nucleic acid-binding Zn-ribbon protein
MSDLDERIAELARNAERLGRLDGRLDKERQLWQEAVRRLEERISQLEQRLEERTK